VRKGARLKGFRASPELGGGTAGRGFEPPVGCLPVVLSRPKTCQSDRLSKRKKKVESSHIAGKAVAGEDDRRVLVTHESSLAATRPSAWAGLKIQEKC